MQKVTISHFKKTKYVMLENGYSFKYKNNYYHIPRKFFFDGGSIPRIAWSLTHPFFHKYLIAFMIHDFFYSKYLQERVKEWIFKKVSRKEADKFLKEMVSKNNKLHWLLFYIAVRCFWWINYWKPLHLKKEDYV